MKRKKKDCREKKDPEIYQALIEPEKNVGIVCVPHEVNNQIPLDLPDSEACSKAHDKTIHLWNVIYRKHTCRYVRPATKNHRWRNR